MTLSSLRNAHYAGKLSSTSCLNQLLHQMEEEQEESKEQNYVPKHHRHDFDVVKRKHIDRWSAEGNIRNRIYDDETLIVSRTIERTSKHSNGLDPIDWSKSLMPASDSFNPAEHGKPRNFTIYKNSLALCSIQVADYKNVAHPYLLVKECTKIDETLSELFEMKRDWYSTLASIIRAGYYVFDLEDMETSRFQVVTMSKIYDRPKISARMPHNIACESLIDECSSRACSAHQLGRKYEIFGGKNLPFYRCSKHHRLLDKSFVSALTVSRDAIGLTNEYILLGASKSPILKLEGFICSVPGKICNLDPRALIDEDRMLNEYGEDYKRDFSITLTTTTSKQDEINLLSSKSFFTNFTIEYLMKRKFIEIAKKLKSKHVHVRGRRLTASVIMEYLADSESICIED